MYASLTSRRCIEHSDLCHRRRKIDIVCGFCRAAAAARRTYKINARRVSISDGDGGAGGGHDCPDSIWPLRYTSCNASLSVAPFSVVVHVRYTEMHYAPRNDISSAKVQFN